MVEHARISPMSRIEDTNEVREFFEHWQSYQKVVDRNYAGHHEAYAALHALLKGRFDSAFTLIDLGCGDAGYMTHAL